MTSSLSGTTSTLPETIENSIGTGNFDGGYRNQRGFRLYFKDGSLYAIRAGDDISGFENIVITIGGIVDRYYVAVDRNLTAAGRSFDAKINEAFIPVKIYQREADALSFVQINLFFRPVDSLFISTDDFSVGVCKDYEEAVFSF